MSGSIGISGGISGAGSFSLAAHAGIGLNPVFGFGAHGGYAAAPFPAVLQFPGVPMLSGGFGASIGLSGGGVSVGLTAAAQAGFAGLSGNLSVNLGFASGTLNLGAAGIGGSLSGGFSPYGLSLRMSLPPLLTQDFPGGLFAGAKWGIFDNNSQPVAAWDSVIKVDYRHDMKISDFPVEKGNFASYNKVQVPYDMRISFAVGSGNGMAKRSDLLVKLEQAVKSLDFYSVLTPEAVYTKANLVHMEYSRESKRGVNLLVVEVWVQEVRPTEGDTFTKDGIQNPKSAAAANPNNSGSVQATDASPALGGPGGATSSIGTETTPTLGGPGGATSSIGTEDMPQLGSGATQPGPPPNMPDTSAPGIPGEAIPGGTLPAPQAATTTPDIGTIS